MIMFCIVSRVSLIHDLQYIMKHFRLRDVVHSIES